MSIHAISGKPGGGKSLFAMKALVKELSSTSRYIVTNLAVKVPELSEWLQKTYGQTFDIMQRLTLLDDDQVFFFWCVRGNGLVLPNVERNDYSKANAENFYELPFLHDESADIRMERKGGRGVCYLIDELHLFFNAREWAKTGKAALFYLSQHRKAGDDVIWITQFVENVDKQFRSVTQDFTYLRNNSKEKFASAFQSVPWFTFKVFQSPVTVGGLQTPSESGRFLLDVKGLANCYDTAKGVGFAGAVAADTKTKRKGLPFWTVIPAAVAVCLVGWFVIDGGLSGLQHLMRFKSQKASSASAAAPGASHSLMSSFVPSVPANASAVAGTSKPGVTAETDLDRAALTSMMRLNGVWYVFLSDGRRLDSTDVRFERLTADGVRFDGVNYFRALALKQPSKPVEYVPPKPVVSDRISLSTSSPGPEYANVHWPDGSVTRNRLSPNTGDAR